MIKTQLKLTSALLQTQTVDADFYMPEMCPKSASKAVPGSRCQSLDCGKANARYGVDDKAVQTAMQNHSRHGLIRHLCAAMQGQHLHTCMTHDSEACTHQMHTAEHRFAGKSTALEVDVADK